MEIKAKVHAVGATQQVSETFKKRDLIVEYAENPSYPEYIKFEALQDKTALLDSLRPGNEVNIHFNLRGRPWTNKSGETNYFNSLVIWKVNVSGQSAKVESTVPEPAASPGTEDDLPF